MSTIIIPSDENIAYLWCLIEVWEIQDSNHCSQVCNGIPRSLGGGSLTCSHGVETWPHRSDRWLLRGSLCSFHGNILHTVVLQKIGQQFVSFNSLLNSFSTKEKGGFGLGARLNGFKTLCLSETALAFWILFSLAVVWIGQILFGICQPNLNVQKKQWYRPLIQRVLFWSHTSNLKKFVKGWPCLDTLCFRDGKIIWWSLIQSSIEAM